MVYDATNLPIDIQTGKLVDWLISRRHIKKNWSTDIVVVRQKISNALQDMPEHPDIVKLLSGSYINYFHCLNIIEILRETEKESKNIFGWYSSQRMKDWQEIVNLYDVDNLHLAEASQYLVRNVSYEIPSLKKQISKCQHTQEECDKKVIELEKSSSSALERYASNCKRLGIDKDKIKEDLIGLLEVLPEKFSEIAEDLKPLKEPLSFYQSYVKFIFGTETSRLPILKFIVEHGNVSVYEWRYGEAPVSISKPDIDFGDQAKETTDEIDFGISVSTKGSAKNDVELETGDIDWGDVDLDVSSGIDFGIELDDTAEESGIVLESSGIDGGIASGDEALSLMCHETTRNELINELLELEGFLSQRVCELKEEENILSVNLFSNSPEQLQYQSVDAISKHLQIISKIMQELTSEKMQHLYMIRSSPKYVDRLVDNLRRHVRESERALGSIDSVKEKKIEAHKQQLELAKHLQVLVSRTKSLQSNVEKKISEKYNNRMVNLMGGIQQI